MSRLRRIAGVLAGLLACSASGAATVELLKDIGANDIAASSNPVFLGAVGNRGYFSARPFNGASRLYRTDGTPASTVPVTTVDTLFSAREGREINGRLVFLGAREAHSWTHDLWSTDGTDAGTHRLFPLGAGEAQLSWQGGHPTSRGYFCYGAFGSCTLYSTDGTSAGTARVLSNRGVYGSLLVGDLLYFGSSTGSTDDGVWISDGTAAGTRELIAISATGLTGLESLLEVDGDAALVSGTDAQGAGVFFVNLASGATTRLTGRNYAVYGPIARVGALRFFIKDFHLWRTDGTAAGTFVLTDSSTFRGVEGPLAVIGDRVLFSNNSNTDGSEIWTSDGSLAGTTMLHELMPGPGGYTRILAATPTHVFYLAGDSGGSVATRFWVTDGTTAGSHVIPVNGSTSYQLPISTHEVGTIAGSRVFFHVPHVIDLPGVSVSYYHMFTTDLAGTAAVDAGPGGLGIPVGDSYLFSTNRDPAGFEPWFSNGTQAGTFRLLDIAVSGQTSSANATDFTAVGNQVFFVADDGERGRELWVTDGSATGTRLVRDIFAGASSGQPSGLKAFGDLLYFAASESGGPSGSTRRLWRSDGTDAGTFSLGDMLAIVGGGSTGGCGSWAAAFNGRVWFFVGFESTTERELWSTDGTPGGTRRELQLPASIRFESICGLSATAHALIFTVNRLGASELWRSDGTTGGTFRLGNVRPALSEPVSGFMSADIVVAGGVAYLLADGGDGFEPWRTDGTTAGTAQIADLTPGVLGAQGYSVTPFREGIAFSYFSETGQANGLWIVASPGSAASRIRSGRVATGRYPVSVGSRVFFLHTDATDTESLWVTEGSALTTREVIRPPAGSLFPSSTRIAGNGVLFVGLLGANGEQLWVTNGTPGSQRQVSNFAGVNLSGMNAALLQGRPVISFNDDSIGIEPWIVRSAPPVAAADSITVTAGGSHLLNVRANDTDPDSLAADLEITLVTAPAHGTAVVDSGAVRYSPAAGYTGSDTFQYRLSDELGVQSSVVTVTVTVNAASGGGGNGGGSGGGGGALDLWLLAMLMTLGWMRTRVGRAHR